MPLIGHIKTLVLCDKRTNGKSSTTMQSDNAFFSKELANYTHAFLFEDFLQPENYYYDPKRAKHFAFFVCIYYFDPNFIDQRNYLYHYIIKYFIKKNSPKSTIEMLFLSHAIKSTRFINRFHIATS